MNLTRTTLALSALCVSILAGCSAPAGDDSADESTAKTDEALSVYQWTNDSAVPNESSQQGAAVYAYGFSFFLAHGGGCGGCTDLWYSIGDINGFPKGDKPMNMWSWYPPTLAGFPNTTTNVYVAHLGSPQNDTHVYFARYNWGTSSWNHDFMLPYQSKGTPAMAVYNNKLYMVGVTPQTNQLWMATMTPDEVFSAATPIPFMYSGDPPSLAVFQNRLYMVHHDGTGYDMVWNYFDGSQWSFDRIIHQDTVNPPTIAAYNGYLHMVHDGGPNDPSDIWWSYFDGITWSTQVSLGKQVGYTPPQPIGMAADYNGGIVMAHRTPFWNPNAVHDFHIYWSRFQ